MTIEAVPLHERPALLERIIAAAIQFRWAILAAVALLCAIGAWSFQRLPIDATPDITNVQVQTNSAAAGFSPQLQPAAPNNLPPLPPTPAAASGDRKSVGQGKMV